VAPAKGEILDSNWTISPTRCQGRIEGGLSHHIVVFNADHEFDIGDVALAAVRTVVKGDHVQVACLHLIEIDAVVTLVPGRRSGREVTSGQHAANLQSLPLVRLSGVLNGYAGSLSIIDGQSGAVTDGADFTSVVKGIF
jgi:hypothetical protein